MSHTIYTSFEEELPGEYYKIVGKVAVAWTLIETDIELMIWTVLGLIDLDKRDSENIKNAQALTTHIGSQTRIHILLSLVHNRLGDSNEFKELNKLFSGEFSELRGKRNNVIHCLPVIEHDSPISIMLYKVESKGKLKSNLHPYSKSDLYDIIDQIHNLRKKLTRLSVWHIAWPDRFESPREEQNSPQN